MCDLKENEHFNFVCSDWGKRWVKILVVNKDKKEHKIKEIEVSTYVSKDNVRDFVSSDNSDVVCTDSQKNILHALAKQHGIENIEQFGLQACNFFLSKYPQLQMAKLQIEEYPWKRLEFNDETHVHAFHMQSDGKRFCEVSVSRQGKPEICAGIRDLRLLKTTMSGFSGFVQDEFCLLPYSDDRLLSTSISATWWYNTWQQNDYEESWNKTRSVLLEAFAGPPKTGVFASSTENALYKIAQHVLSTITEIEKLEITFPNRHYVEVDFSKFPSLDLGENKSQVYTGLDKPSGHIHAVIERSRL